jgi:ABC-type uncharacterized transport system involved in gliding motility auxiliary subunit
MGNNKHNRLKYGSLSVGILAIVIAIAVFINLIMIKYDIKWDLTPNKIYSLSEETEELIKNLDKEVTIYGLFDDGTIPMSNDLGSAEGTYEAVTKLIDKYKSLSSKIKVKYIDPLKDPDILTELDRENTQGLKQGDFFFVCGNKGRKVMGSELMKTYYSQENEMLSMSFFTAETKFTSAIKIVSSDRTPTIYFTQGHQETNYEENYTFLKDGVLEYFGYETKSLDLMTSEKVPEDADAIFVMGPKMDLTPSESQKITDYLNKGGKALFMFDPIAPNRDLPEFDKVLAEYGMVLNYDRVKENDSSRHTSGDPYSITISPEVNEINAKINQYDGFKIAMPNSRSINILKTKKDGLEVTPLLKTSKTAVGEQIDKSKGRDLDGPLNLGVAAEYPSIGAKIMVIGNASFFTDRFLREYNSIYFFDSINDFLLYKDDSINIQSKSMEAERLNLTQREANITGIIIVFVVPFLIFAIGTAVWMRRRHL